MSTVHFPQWTTGNVGITALQVLGLGGAASELQGNNAGYSKFANPAANFKVPSRLGMVILYSPALLVSLRYLQTAPNVNGRESITAMLLSAHFGKRVLESMFLHRYSGTMNGDFLLPISTSYALTAALVAHQQRSVPSYSNTAIDQKMLGLGLLFSVVGQLGNLYHHWLLANLRSGPAISKGDGNAQSKYVIPRGGLFRFVTTPHYFFELIAWLGIACTAQHLNAFLTVADMLSYLAGRSVATTKWYKSKFPDYPSERKNLIPFLF